MIAVGWPDGRVDEAADWEDLLGVVNRLPWNSDMTELEFRHALGKRAKIWGGVYVDDVESATAEELFRSLDSAGLLTILAAPDSC